MLKTLKRELDAGINHANKSPIRIDRNDPYKIKDDNLSRQFNRANSVGERISNDGNPQLQNQINKYQNKVPHTLSNRDQGAPRRPTEYQHTQN